MAAKIIMVFNDQNACVGISLSVEMRRRKTTDTTAHNDQIINRLIGLLNGAPICSTLTSKCVRNIESAIVIAPHTRQSGRIIGVYLGSGLATAEQ
jgi:hypothetical protein